VIQLLRVKQRLTENNGAYTPPNTVETRTNPPATARYRSRSGGTGMSTLALAIPKGWEVVTSFGDGYAFRQIGGGLRVIVDCAEKADGRQWLHVSASRKSWAPSHEDMALVKDAFIGPTRYAYSVWAPASLHVNIHPFCLHLWALIDGPDGQVLPEFSDEVPGLGRSI